MATQRKRASAAQHVAILEMIAEKPRSVADLAGEVALSQKEVLRVLKLYVTDGSVHQLWALTPLQGRDGVPAKIAARHSVPFTLFLPFPAEEVAA